MLNYTAQSDNSQQFQTGEKEKAAAAEDANNFKNKWTSWQVI